MLVKHKQLLSVQPHHAGVSCTVGGCLSDLGAMPRCVCSELITLLKISSSQVLLCCQRHSSRNRLLLLLWDGSPRACYSSRGQPDHLGRRLLLQQLLLYGTATQSSPCCYTTCCWAACICCGTASTTARRHTPSSAARGPQQLLLRLQRRTHWAEAPRCSSFRNRLPRSLIPQWARCPQVQPTAPRAPSRPCRTQRAGRPCCSSCMVCGSAVELLAPHGGAAPLLTVGISTTVCPIARCHTVSSTGGWRGCGACAASVEGHRTLACCSCCSGSGWETESSWGAEGAGAPGLQPDGWWGWGQGGCRGPDG